MRYPIRAIIWDYDGTLADTRARNLNVTRRIIQHISGIEPIQFPALASLEKYYLATLRTTNWRDFYRREFELEESQIDEAGKLWTDYQLQETTPAPLFDGIDNVIRSLRQYPQGIVSQNSQSNITNYLSMNNLSKYFRSVIGYEGVDLNKQKPDPDGLLLCIERLAGSSPGYVLYIGDHETDVLCARNAGQVLKAIGSALKVISIAAVYGLQPDTTQWSAHPDHKATTVREIATIVERFT